MWGTPLDTCDPTYPNVLICANVHQYCELEVNDTMLSFRAMDTTGTEIDRFALTCAGDLHIAFTAGYSNTAAGEVVVPST